MRSLRIAIAGLLIPAVALLAGCRTEKTTSQTEVTRAGGETKVKKTETHKSDKEDVKRVETKKYHD